jgi:hypothetical protein
MPHNGAVNLRSPAPAAALLAILLAAGCGGSGKNSTHPAITTTGGPSATTGASPGATQSSHPGKPAPGAGKTSARAIASATASEAPGSGPSGQPAAAATYTAPGSYTYDSKGKATVDGQANDASGTQTLMVDPPSGASQHSSLGGDQGGGTEQNVVHRDSGTYLARLVVKSPLGDKEFHPAQPVLGVAKPEQMGRSWSWSMTSTDGKTRADYSAKFVRQETVTIGGKSVRTWVIESTLKISGDIDLTEHNITNYDPSRLLEVRMHGTQSGKITFQGVPHTFTSDVTSTLRSVKPS